MFVIFFHCIVVIFLFFFFFNDTATTEIYTLSLHDALPIAPVITQLHIPFCAVPLEKLHGADVNEPPLTLQKMVAPVTPTASVMVAVSEVEPGLLGIGV